MAIDPDVLQHSAGIAGALIPEEEDEDGKKKKTVGTGAAKGAVSGLSTGAALGTKVFPGIGTAIGALAGLVIGGIGGAAKGGKEVAARRKADKEEGEVRVAEDAQERLKALEDLDLSEDTRRRAAELILEQHNV